MRILVTGIEGMVGSEMWSELVSRGHEVIPTDLKPTSPDTLKLDVRDRPTVEKMLKEMSPNLVIHLAAETDVDRCEQEPEYAYSTNSVGTENVASQCQIYGVRLVYVSTAGVFDGEKPTPYIEGDMPNPVNVYGRSKLSGEYAVRHYVSAHQIVRAGWMFGGYSRDKKFVGKILRLLERQRTISVVTDKFGSPTFSEDLSRGIATLIDKEHFGVFHMTNCGVCSRYDVALKLVDILGRKDVTLLPITSDKFPLPAPRARSEAMDNRRLLSLGLDLMRGWEEALEIYVRKIIGEQAK